jgi:4-diphosphocytidyl-2-C-methyl-D-erythritol kinase
MKVLKLKSPGKINLRLDVIGKRADGYHDLQMINSLVNVYDDIEIELIDKGLIVECTNDTNVPSGEENIVYKVAKEIMAYSNKNIGVCIRIHKHIPSSAGMGGGSSNAACVLMGLNDLLKINLPKDKLMKIGVKFGADVPFFILQRAGDRARHRRSIVQNQKDAQAAHGSHYAQRQSADQMGL